MERIKEEIKKTIIETTVTYKAIDGTIFTNETECRRYEETAEAVLLAKLNDFKISETNTNDFFESGGEGTLKFVVPKTPNDIDILNQLWKLNEGAINSTILFSVEDINTLIAVGIRISNGKTDWVWFYKVDNIIRKVTNNNYTITEFLLNK